MREREMRPTTPRDNRLALKLLTAAAAAFLATAVSQSIPAATAETGSSSKRTSSKEVAAMKGFIGDIEHMTEENSDFRRVLYTAKQLQLVLMALRPGEEIGEEVHSDRDQFFRIEEGHGEVWINGKASEIKSDMAILVPAGARHNIKNTGDQPLKLYTLYAPPEHLDKTVHATRSDAEASHEHFDGKTTE
jgi:mannose-6-phosphate isomerase-like protein (cupin superfamily)